MKKLIATLLMAGTLALTACQPDKISSADTKSKLSSKNYTVLVSAEAEAKELIKGLNYEGVTFTDAISATKGENDNKDFLIAFYFANSDAAGNFVSKNDHENLAMMNAYAEKELRANLTKKVGTHNNVAYVGSETAASIAFDI